MLGFRGLRRIPLIGLAFGAAEGGIGLPDTPGRGEESEVPALAGPSPKQEDATPSLQEFNAKEDILVIYFDDPADPPVDFSFSDNGGSGTTVVSLFGTPALSLKGNIAEIGLTEDDIVAVNLAVA